MSDTFDSGKLLTACGGDAELAGQVVGVFLSDTPKQLKNLEVALAGADAKTAERVAHSIKGAAATVGGENLRALAFECEQLGRDAKLTEVTALLPALREKYDLLRVELEKAGYRQE